ncbi:DUF1566 domain-containing protein [uncultured Photobacterium sp.]|uniref:Lcl C-terminal domain-containing protein n=1 Tax=uncultured Photobacterium sp. TaxID=173973 RepID=UPI0026067299|nr:DUF1566 domain-containing protein [uncultured Photobacterium sp.]
MRKSGFILLAALSFSAGAQVCNEQMVSSTHDNQYAVNSDGTVIDAVNGLVWQACSLGQTYTDNDCQGSPLEFADWPGALTAVRSYNNDNNSNYRLPSIMELDALVERSCAQPAIRLDAFPSTPNGWFWTSSYDGQVNTGTEGRMINFSDGLEFDDGTNSHRYIRLVKNLGED